MLVVDGERARYAVLADALDTDDLLLARNPREARDRLESTDPSAMLLAGPLDEETASLVEDVRSGRYGHRGLPIVAVTDGDRELALSLGVDETVQAPVAGAAVEEALERATLLGHYKAAINDFYDACRRCAEGAGESERPLAARRTADEALAEIQDEDGSIAFESLIESV